MQEAKDGLQVCRIKLLEERKKAFPLREDHLLNCLREAVQKGKKKKASGIKQIINSEKGRKAWRHINYVLNDPRNPPVTAISRMEGDEEVSYSNEEGVKMVFREE